jgi:hypothetical protein
MYAAEDIVDLRAQTQQLPRHIVVDALQLSRIDPAERHPALIGHDNHQQIKSIEEPYPIDDGGNQPKLPSGADILALRRLEIDHTIAVQENAAAHYQWSSPT